MSFKSPFCRPIGFLLLAVFLLIFFRPVPAQDTNYYFKITNLIDVLPEEHTRIIDVVTNYPLDKIDFYQLRIAYDAENSPIMRIMDRGHRPLRYKDFTFSFYPDEYKPESYPSGLLKVKGQFDYYDYPYEYDDSTEWELMEIWLDIPDSWDHICQKYPFRFFWTSCSDNIIVLKTGDTIFLSNDVFTPDGEIITSDTLFPSYYGAPSVCTRGVMPDDPTAHIRGVDFINGGVEYICLDISNDRGDLDLSGIPFEPSDVYEYISYFRFGHADFNIDYERQLNASDVNRDGTPLTLEDFMYMMRVRSAQHRDAEFYKYRTGNAVCRFIEDASSVAVEIDNDLPVGGLHLMYYAPGMYNVDINRIDPYNHFGLEHSHLNDTLHLLLYGYGKCTDPWDQRCRIAVDTGLSRVLEINFSGADSLHLLSCELAGYFGESFDETIVFEEQYYPEIVSGCGEFIIADEPAMAIQFEVADDDDDMHTWSVETVEPEPDGSYDIDNNGFLTFTANTTDIGKRFYFEVKVEDSAGHSDKCGSWIDISGTRPFAFKVDLKFDQMQGQSVNLPVRKVTGSEYLYGFDFTITYNNTGLIFQDVIPGELFNENGDYKWEYFTYRYINLDECDGCDFSSAIHVVSVADINDGANHPLSYHVPDGTILFTLNYFVSNDYLLQGKYLPVEFYWLDCRDNMVPFGFNGEEVDRLALSRNVYSWNNTSNMYENITDDRTGFPTFTGAQNYCIDNPYYINNPIGLIDYYGGGVQIISADSIDDRGDVNLNGIANEIADFVLFSRYLVGCKIGDVFPDNLAAHIAATDVNANDIPGELEDLTFMSRIIIGDAIIPPDDVDTATIHLNPGANSLQLYIQSDTPLGAFFIEYESDTASEDIFIPSGSFDDFEYFTGHCEGVAKTLYASLSDAQIDDGYIYLGEILCPDGNCPQIMEIDAGGYYGEEVLVVIDNPLSDTEDKDEPLIPETFGLAQNRPNPFNMQTTISFDLPNPSSWQFEIYNIMGQVVRRFEGHDNAGTVNINWDGTDNNGREVSSGIYFYHLKAGQFEQTKKMVLLK